MNPPLVSYVILTRNRCEEVIGCLRNVKEQDYPHREMILVDNGSTDPTVKKVRDLFPEVRLVALDRNLGVAGGRNRGIEAAHGEICILIDDDARFAGPDETRRLLTYFQKNDRVACVAFRILNPQTGLEDRKTIPRVDKRAPQKDEPVAYFCGAGFAMRRRVFLNLGGFWEPLIYVGEELDLSYRLLNEGYDLVYAPSISVIHREVSQGRPKGQWVYYQTRNRCWISVRNLPWHFVFSTTLLWWGYTAWVALTHREFIFFVKGGLDAVRGLPQALKNRKPLKKSVIPKIRRLSGRLWY